MVPSVNVMCTASRAMLKFSRCADLAGSIAGAESALHTAAGEAAGGVCAAMEMDAKRDAKATMVILLGMEAPTGSKKLPRPSGRGKWQFGYTRAQEARAHRGRNRSEMERTAIV